jgi:glycerol-3-phosphate dehydrogenase
MNVALPGAERPGQDPGSPPEESLSSPFPDVPLMSTGLPQQPAGPAGPGDPRDVVVVGGGILGACVARDAAMRGLSVTLLERGTFGGGTSANSLRVIHGGLRHLQHLDLREFRRSVAERRAWLRIAPHLVEPLPVLVPWERRSEGLLLRVGLLVNDLLSGDRNRGVPSRGHLPRGRMLDRGEAMRRLGPFATPRVRGAALYHDAFMDRADEVVEAVLAAARNAGARTLDHVECTGPLVEEGVRVGIRARDRRTNQEVQVRARSIVNAAGPTASGVEARILGSSSPGRGRGEALSVAWNLELPAMGLTSAVAVRGNTPTPTGSGGSRPRRIFLVPWRDRTLVGTGHARFDDDPGEFRGLGPGDPLILAFLDELNDALPGSPVTPGDILGVQAGLLPAHPGDGSGDHVRLRRKPAFSMHREGGVPLLTVSTVKFTSSRLVAEKGVDRLTTALASPPPAGAAGRSRTATVPLPGAASRVGTGAGEPRT